MIFIVLSGGIGSRLSNSVLYSKPLNLIKGQHSICYCLNSIPQENIYMILNRKLKEYNFDTLLPHLNLKKKINFIYLDNDTRGPIETAYLGLKKMNLNENEQICFIDNDTIYNLQNVEFPKGNFICYSELENECTERPYCFLKEDKLILTEISEKKTISNKYACGIYGFESVKTFMSKSKELLSDVSKTEYFMSLLHSNLLLDKCCNIQCVNVNGCVCLGTFDDINNNSQLIPKTKKRFCFDIDNTILKYRKSGQSYRDCEVIQKQIFLIKELKKLGHTIILYTARGMKTANNNLGICLKNVAKDTFENLEKNNIEFDEIYFGKPEADFYIDDKGYNPYLNLFDALGFSELNEEYSKSQLIANTTNKFNYVYRNNNIIIKCGTIDSIEGEKFFYEKIKNTNISEQFPKLYSSEKTDYFIKLNLEYINGITLFDLLKNGLFSNQYIDLVIDSINIMHNCSDISINLSHDHIYQNYIGKLITRKNDKNNYPFENTDKIIGEIDIMTRDYIYNRLEIVSVVHGDSWFSNTVLTTKNKIVFLDMKGNVNGIFTTNGDSITDFGKMLQSLLGFDYIVNNIDDYDKDELTKLRQYFLIRLSQKYLLKDIYTITAALIAKTFHFLTVDLSVRKQLWNIVEDLCQKDTIF
jgi:capsule biosynthesis phosphatase